ncbi:CHASE3 domain-containing protein [Ancylothrix sp. C2]|uniref:CHASE3 domain-containing protein n=1 Tax=Ancylothrix sp. D3o TaxID=2953691 RepID=UPI0021BB7E4B|nr:CHASE3 domain-containing protein [Ancylothrix sp. D3o]MCT7949776.1 CHASE3 domain-containing protein [Ancylothrix sp. D3o]
MLKKPVQTNTRLSRILPFAFGSLFLLMLVNALISQSSTKTLVQSVGSVTHSYQVKGKLKQLEKLLVDGETGQRGYIFTGKENFLEPYINANQELKVNFAELYTLLQDNPEQTKKLTEVQKLASDKLEEMAETITLKRAGKNKQLMDLVVSGQGKKIMDDIRNKLAEMNEVETILLSERQKAATQAEQWMSVSSVAVPLAAIIFGLVILFFIGKKVVSPINEVARLIAISSQEIAATVEQHERTAIMQASSVNQTSTTMIELGASSRHSAEQAESAAENARLVLNLAESSTEGARQVLSLAESSAEGARQVLNLAEEGSKRVRQTVEEMSILKEKVALITDQMIRLNDQTGRIGSITNIVTDLAAQTNMLALNAAVEAARAGSNGKGFGIIASEIRQLANESKKSAHTITSLVTAIQSAMNSTVMATEEGRKTTESSIKLSQETAEAFSSVTQAIDEIVLAASTSVTKAINEVILSNQENSLKTTNEIVINSQQISLTAKQQAVAIQQVIEVMANLNQGAAETASGISQTKIGIQNLNEAAQNLNSVV